MKRLTKTKKKQSVQPGQKMKVLYQNLNGTWYAFAENGEDIYFGRVPVSHKADPSKAKKEKSSEKGAA